MVRLAVLDRKVIRDLARMWAQVLAIALVMACGVMTIVLAVGASRSLEETRAAYYDRYRFGHVFASATRIPDREITRIRAIDGVAAVEARIVRAAVLDIPAMAEPATAMGLSLAESGEPAVNRLYIRKGRLPRASHANEVAIDERFARAHGFSPGDRFGVHAVGDADGGEGRDAQGRVFDVAAQPHRG